jgi:thiamine-monophosphate kinase
MSDRKISEIGEFEFISRLGLDLPELPGVLKSVGDDTAVLGPDEKGRLLLLTTDTIVEGVHFLKSAPCFDVGWKAMASNISDIAAMGGQPMHAVVALSAPESIELASLDELYDGMKAVADKFGVNIVGGDTTRSKQGLIVTVTLTGRVERERVALRSSARPGDRILVTGKLGGSILGRHLRFGPRVDEARFLVEHFSPLTMIDLSDGLASDISRIAEQSSVGARIFAEKVPVSDDAVKLSQKDKVSPVGHALFDGEDFELLITMGPEKALRACGLFEREFDLCLTVVGEIVKEAGKVTLVDVDKTEHELKPGGYDHFKKHN